jgi:hypothetical protein
MEVKFSQLRTVCQSTQVLYHTTRVGVARLPNIVHGLLL